MLVYEPIYIFGIIISRNGMGNVWRKQTMWTIAHDASLSGFGFTLERAPHNNIDPQRAVGTGFLGLWSSTHLQHIASSADIQWAELFAIVFALHVYASLLRDQSIELI